jgi:predicted Na+-dependent transporter
MAYSTILNEWLSKRMFMVVLAAIGLGYCLHIPESPVVRFLLVALFAYMTFVTSLNSGLKSFIEVLGRPWVPLWALLLIHIVTPLMAYLLGNLFLADAEQAKLGLLVGAAIPVGVTSLIWTALSRGNIAVCLVAVTLDTFIVPVLLPFYYKLIVDQSVIINYQTLVIQLVLMVTIPSIAGMVLYDWSGGQIAGFAKGIGGVTAKLALFLVVLLNASLVAPEIHWSLSIVHIMAVVLLLVVSGYALGYVGALCIPNYSRDIMMAMIYSVGMRNISCGLVIAITYFPPAVAVPITLCMLFQQPIAAAIPNIFRYFEARKLPC